MLSIDQPLRLGDLVRVEDVVGYVEQIGLRSTAIRTLDRSLVTFPNATITASAGRLGHSVLVALERLMGMLLVALSVQMFLNGIVAYVRMPLAS